MNITLHGKNLDLTENLREFVNQKISDCIRALGDTNLDPINIDVELERTTRRHPNEREDEQLFRAEAIVFLPGQTIRSEESAMDIEQAVVKLKHTLTREIRKWRERRIESRRKGARIAKSLPAEENQPMTTEKTEEWSEDWTQEEERIKDEIKKEKDKKWEEWEENGEDLRDFV